MATIIARGKKAWFRGWQPVTLIDATVAQTSVTAGAGDIYFVGDYEFFDSFN